MLQKEENLKKIVERLESLRREVEEKGRLSLLDVHTLCENFIKELLNRVYGLNLADLNERKRNHPGLDLGDRINGIAYQITADGSTAKIQDTLAQCVESKLYKEFSKIRVFVLTTKKKSSSLIWPGKLFKFSYKDHVFDFSDIYSKLKRLNAKETEKILAFIESELPKVWTPKSFDPRLSGLYYFFSYFEYKNRSYLSKYPVEIGKDGKADMHAVQGIYHGRMTSHEKKYSHLHFGSLTSMDGKKPIETAEITPESFVLETFEDLVDSRDTIHGVSLGIQNDHPSGRRVFFKRASSATEWRKIKKGKKYLIPIEEATDLAKEDPMIARALAILAGRTNNYIQPIAEYSLNAFISLNADSLPGKAYFFAALLLRLFPVANENEKKLIRRMLDQAFLHRYGMQNTENGKKERRNVIDNISCFGDLADLISSKWEINAAEMKSRSTGGLSMQMIATKNGSEIVMREQIKSARENILLINNYIPNLQEEDLIHTFLEKIETGEIKKIEIYLLDFRAGSQGRAIAAMRDSSLVLKKECVKEIKACIEKFLELARRINASSLPSKPIYHLHLYNSPPTFAYSQYNPEQALASLFFSHKRAFDATHFVIDLTRQSDFGNDIKNHIKQLAIEVRNENEKEQCIFNLLEKTDIDSLTRFVQKEE